MTDALLNKIESEVKAALALNCQYSGVPNEIILSLIASARELEVYREAWQRKFGRGLKPVLLLPNGGTQPESETVVSVFESWSTLLDEEAKAAIRHGMGQMVTVNPRVLRDLIQELWEARASLRVRGMEETEDTPSFRDAHGKAFDAAMGDRDG